MTSVIKAGWSSLGCKRCQLNLRAVLTSGQSFRWRETGTEEFTGVMRNIVWTLSQTDNLLLYKVHARFENSTRIEKNTREENVLSECRKNQNAGDSDTAIKRQLRIKSKSQSVVQKEKQQNDGDRKLQADHAFLETDPIIDETVVSECKRSTPSFSEAGGGSLETKYLEYEAILMDYFQLSVDIEALYHTWSVRDSQFSLRNESSKLLMGIRLLRQDPVETLLSFICSSNNNISRIGGMVERMCAEFGQPIATIDGHIYHTVPSIWRLSLADVEPKLREIGFGYRAKYISQTAQTLLTSAPGRPDTACDSCCAGYQTPPSYCLCVWRCESCVVARTGLMKLSGVGPKVADCVCLMSLDKHDVVPIDTHVWQIAARDYNLVSSTSKTLTDVIYRQIGDGFRELWGPYAGWAQAVLFASEVAKVKVTAVKRSKQAGTDGAVIGERVRIKKR